MKNFLVNHELSYFSQPTPLKGRYYNSYFPQGFIPSHNFCRNLKRTPYTPEPVCIGVRTEDTLRCSTTCSGKDIARYTLIGFEYKSLMAETQTGRKCYEGRHCKLEEDVRLGISCAVAMTSRTTPGQNLVRFEQEQCEAPI